MYQHNYKYRNSRPFPYAIIKDFFNEPDLTECLNSIENNIKKLKWKQHDYHFQVNKRWLEDPTAMPLEVQKIIWELHSTEFLHFLKEITGISGIIDDPLNIGGGIHCTGRGGKLNIQKILTTIKKQI